MSALTTGVLEHRAQETTTATRKEKTEHKDAQGRVYSTAIRSVPDHLVIGDLEIWVDWVSLIHQKGRRALLSKSGKAQIMSGAIVIKATNRRNKPL